VKTRFSMLGWDILTLIVKSGPIIKAVIAALNVYLLDLASVIHNTALLGLVNSVIALLIYGLLSTVEYWASKVPTTPPAA
jgi:hypothetical protein